MDHIIYIAAVFAVAGVIKGAGGADAGWGWPAVAMALLSLAMPPSQAAALLIVPSLLTNLWQTMEAGSGAPRAYGAPGHAMPAPALAPALYPLWQRLWPMMAGIVAGTLLGGAAAVHVAQLAHGAADYGAAPSTDWASGALGLALVIHAAPGLLAVRWHVAPAAETWLSPLAGALTGLVSAVTGVFTVPAVTYLQALGLEAEHRERLVQATGLAGVVATVALAVSLAARGVWEPAVAGLSFAAQLPALAGILLGQRLRGRLHRALFARGLPGALLLLGMYMALKAAWS